MKALIPALLLVALPLFGTADEQIVTLGDSLTFAYEVEFGPGFSVPGLPPLVGDDMGPEVRNWIEILADPAYRSAHFAQGGEIDVTVAFFWEFYLRREFNWAIPGIRIDDLRDFLAGDVTVTELLAASGNFEGLSDFLLLTEFGASDYHLPTLQSQLANTAERVVLFIGGNDANGIYGPVYQSNAPGTFVADFLADATWIVDWVLAQNPGIEFVLVNVPHVGITPLIKSEYPPDPVKTARVTAVFDDLNAQLAALAASRDIGYADIYGPTLALLASDPLCLHGLPFQNAGSVLGDLDYVWLDGQVSDNFHPNTNAQALIANQIILAFNHSYDTGIAPLSANEMLGGLLAKAPAEIDLPFADWMTCFGFPGGHVGDDQDRDGLAAGLEFALGLDPTRQDAELVQSGLVEEGGTLFFELAYPTRLPASTRYTLTSMSATDLNFSPLVPAPAESPDGLTHARLPVGSGKGFLQLEAVVGP